MYTSEHMAVFKHCVDVWPSSDADWVRFGHMVAASYLAIVCPLPNYAQLPTG